MKRKKKRNRVQETDLSAFRRTLNRKKKFHVPSPVRFLAVTASAVLLAVDTKTFIYAGNLFPGGVAGVTLLLIRSAEKFTGAAIPYMPVNLLLNAVPIYIGFRYLGRRFTAWACYNIVLTSVLTDLIPAYVITQDVLLISVFGGVLSAVASVLCLWVDSTAGGTDFISVYLSVRKGIDAWNVIFAFNVVILMIAGALFGWDKALYSMIFQYVVTQMVNALYQNYQQQTFLILTEKPKQVTDRIYQLTGHGATMLEGYGSYEHMERNVIYSVVSRNESRMVMREVQKVDPDAFINSIRTEKLKGHFYKKPLA